jgi:hypothetical protein
LIFLKIEAFDRVCCASCDRFWCETGVVIAACLREAFDCVMVIRIGCGKRPQDKTGKSST